MVGTQVAISATTATTFNTTGYDALTFTPLGLATAVPEVVPQQAKNTIVPVATGVPIQRGGAYEFPDFNLEVALTGSDAGEVIIKGIANQSVTSRKLAALKFTYPTGDIVYMQVIVRGFGNVNGDSGAINIGRAILSMDGHLPIEKAV